MWRYAVVVSLAAACLGQSRQGRTVVDPETQQPVESQSGDAKLPNGKSQKDAISKQAHEDALKDVESLIRLAEDLRDELKHSGEYVVAVSSLRKTEEIEKLARHIRGRLKA